MTSPGPAAPTSRFGLWSATYPEEWATLDFEPGDIITATLPMHFTEHEGVQGVFVVLGSFQDGAGGFTAQLRSLGSSNQEVTQKLSKEFNRRSGYVHFCRSLDDCEYGEGVVFHLRVFTKSDPIHFQSEYVGATGKKLLKQTLSDLGIQKDAEPLDADRESEDERKRGRGAKPDRRKPGDEEKEKKRRDRGKGGGETLEAPRKPREEAAKYKDLRERLEAIRRGQSDTPGEEVAEGDGADPNRAAEKTPRLGTGRKLMMLGAEIDDFCQQTATASAKGDATEKKKPLEEKPRSRSVGNQLALLATSREVTSGSARGGVPGAGGSKKKKKKKKSDKKKKKKAAKRRRAGQRGGGGGGGSSPSSSSSSSRTSQSSRDNRSSSTESLLPPLQKRSRREAGSVLKLLIRQVEEQLSELQGTDPNAQALLGGTKMVAYYHLMIKGGGLQVNSRDGRELFLLANLIDLLRVGQLALLGDGLASRFLAIQQAQLDSNWIAARHLEIFTPEVVTAAGASMTLEARRHARLVEKAKGATSSRGRAEGGSWGRTNNWNSNPWDGYGDTPKGKGKKGRGKPKGGYGQAKGNDSWRGGTAWESGGKGKSDKEKTGDKEKDSK